MFYGLGRKYIESRLHEMLPGTPYIMFEVARSNRLEDAITIKYIIWPLIMTLGSRSHKMLPSTLYVMWPIQV